jgi:coenzyme F420-dependent glucose-6-phosphate dehydrogenase
VAGRRGDGLWTVPDPDSTQDVIEAYREAGGGGDIVFQAQFAWAPTDEQAFERLRKWKGAQPDDHYTRDWHRPAEMYEHGEREVSDEQLASSVIVGSDPDEHAERLRELERLGPTVIILQNSSSADPLGAIRVYGERVLPALRGVSTMR